MSGLWDFEKDDYPGARQDFLNGVGCPHCKWGLTEEKQRPLRARLAQMVMGASRKDIDGAASDLEDAEFFWYDNDEKEY
jgi:hypothetical protein